MEIALVKLVALKLSVIGIFVFLYIVGGRGHKWIRRWVGGLFFGSGIIGLSFITNSFKWPLLAIIPSYPIALSLGYSGNTFIVKFSRRVLYGVAFASIGIWIGMWTGTWLLAIFQAILAIEASTYLGILNPVNAVYEEAQIALISVCCVPFMV